MPMLDLGISNMIQDFHDRGMGDDVVTIVWGEFGRTPRINGNAGRDHWPAVMSCMIAGGGLKMGQAVGASTERGESPQGRAYTPAQLLATIYRVLRNGTRPAPSPSAILAGLCTFSMIVSRSANYYKMVAAVNAVDDRTSSDHDKTF